MLSADAIEQAGTLYVAAVVEDVDGDGRQDVVFAHGGPYGVLADSVMPFNPAGPVQEAEHATIWADADRVAVGVTSRSAGAARDGVSWVFMRTH